MASIGKFHINEQQKKAILDLEEDHFNDLKSIDISPGKLTKTLAAFSNAAGGELFIGIDEITRTKVRSWRGFSDQEDANQFIQTFEELFPLGQHYSYEFLYCEGCQGYVLRVSVLKTNDIKRASDGKIYVRRGAQNLPVESQDRIKRLEYDKGIVSFETEKINIDKNLVTNSVVVLRFILEIIPLAEPETWLKKQLLLRDEKPTVACALLFAELPQAILPKRCAVKIYRYKTKDEEGNRDTLDFQPITIEGCAYDVIKDTVDQTIEIIESMRVITDDGFQKINYPRETLHEIITNAVLHRDYSIAADIQVKIFDNRVEIISPGVLPGHITEKNILTEQFARNPSLVRIINKFPDPPNKDVGEGLNTAFEAMKKLRLKTPEIVEQENNVVVYIRHEPLAVPEDAVMEYLKTNEEITNSIARNITGITSENTMKNVFYRLRDRSMIERVPDKKGRLSAWRKRVK